MLVLPLGILFIINLVGGGFTYENILYDVLIVIILDLVVAGVLAGTTIFGSGLSGESVFIATLTTSLLALWGALTFNALSIFPTIPYGMMMYGTITLIYIIGIVLSLVRGE